MTRATKPALFALVGLVFASAGCGRSSLGARDDGGTGRDGAGFDGARPDGSRPDAGRCRDDFDCDDGLVCNGLDACVDGVCVVAPFPACADGIDCTDDRCEESLGGACVFVPDATRCEPGAVCDPGVGCVLRRCTSDFDCDDGFVCNGRETCARDAMGRGRCAPGEPLRCEDGDACTIDRCEEGAGGCISFFDPRCGGAETDCANGVDDDGDGFVDCDDFDCAVRPECGGVCAPVEFECFDMRDEDCDGLFDCDDPDCFGFPGCGMTCASEELDCANGIDDDCDMLFDCDDPECRADPRCGPVCVPRRERCANGEDDDCDTFVDCEDVDCRSAPACVGVDGGVPDGGMCTAREIGITACTNRRDDDCDGQRDCTDSDCTPFGPGTECCNRIDDDGDGQVDLFTCRCTSDLDCRGVGSLEQVCWTTLYSVCAPRCDFYGGDLFCQMFDPSLRCQRATGQCVIGP